MTNYSDSEINILSFSRIIETINKSSLFISQKLNKQKIENNNLLEENKNLLKKLESSEQQFQIELKKLQNEFFLKNKSLKYLQHENYQLKNQIKNLKEIIFYYQNKLQYQENISIIKNEVHYHLQEEFKQQNLKNEILQNEIKRKNEYFDNHHLNDKSFMTFSKSIHNQPSVNIPIIDIIEVDISNKVTNNIINFKNNLYTVSPLLTDEEIKSNKEKIFLKSKDIELKKLRPIRNYILNYSYASVSTIINYRKNQHQKKISDTSIKKYFLFISKCYKNIRLLTPLKRGKGHELILILNDLIT